MSIKCTYFVLTLSERGVPGDASLSPSRGGQSPTSHHGEFVTGTYTHDQCLGPNHWRARVVQPERGQNNVIEGCCVVLP